MTDPLYHEATPSELAEARRSPHAAVRCQVDPDPLLADHSDAEASTLARTLWWCALGIAFVVACACAAHFRLWDALTGIQVGR